MRSFCAYYFIMVAHMHPIHNSTLTVHTDRLRRNIASVSAQLRPGCSIIAVLKCDAYGLGLVPCAKVLSPLPAVSMFAVAHPAEGLALREAGITKPVLVMAPALPTQLRAAADAGLTLTVGRPGMLPALAGLGKPVHVQIKIETGLHRTGFVPEELPALIAELQAAGSAIIVDGVYSHFSSSSDASLCAKQFALYEACVAQLEQAGVSVPLRHICASESSELFPRYHLDAVRLGRRLFMDNLTPNGTVEEVMEWKTRILDLRPRPAGAVIGYNGALTAQSGCLIADIGVGYGDGLPLGLAEQGGRVLIGGRLCPIVSACMDQTLVDVTGVPCAVGDTVTIFGTDEYGNTLTSQGQSAVYGGNEGCSITSALSPRVYREYI